MNKQETTTKRALLASGDYKTLFALHNAVSAQSTEAYRNNDPKTARTLARKAYSYLKAADRALYAATGRRS